MLILWSNGQVDYYAIAHAHFACAIFCADISLRDNAFTLHVLGCAAVRVVGEQSVKWKRGGSD